MSKRTVFAIAVVASLAVTPAFASAKLHAKSHTVKLSGLIETLSSTGAVGVPGTRDTDSGILDGKLSGRSVGRAAFYQTSTWGPGLTLVGSGRVLTRSGASSSRPRRRGRSTPTQRSHTLANSRSRAAPASIGMRTAPLTSRVMRPQTVIVTSPQ